MGEAKAEQAGGDDRAMPGIKDFRGWMIEGAPGAVLSSREERKGQDLGIAWATHQRVMCVAGKGFSFVFL